MVSIICLNDVSRLKKGLNGKLKVIRQVNLEKIFLNSTVFVIFMFQNKLGKQYFCSADLHVCTYVTLVCNTDKSENDCWC